MSLAPAIEELLEEFPESRRDEILRHAQAMARKACRPLAVADLRAAAQPPAPFRSAPCQPAQKSCAGLLPGPSAHTMPVAPVRRPLMPFKTLMWALYRDEKHINALIGDRKLIAFNVAAAASVRTNQVIWVASIVDYLANRPPPRATDETIMADIFPGQQATFRVSHLARLFTVSSDHVTNLVKEGTLENDKSKPCGRCRGMTRHIFRESIIRFLKNRRIS